MTVRKLLDSNQEIFIVWKEPCNEGSQRNELVWEQQRYPGREVSGECRLSHWEPAFWVPSTSCSVADDYKLTKNLLKQGREHLHAGRGTLKTYPLLRVDKEPGKLQWLYWTWSGNRNITDSSHFRIEVDASIKKSIKRKMKLPGMQDSFRDEHIKWTEGKMINIQKLIFTANLS